MRSTDSPHFGDYLGLAGPGTTDTSSSSGDSSSNSSSPSKSGSSDSGDSSNSNNSPDLSGHNATPTSSLFPEDEWKQPVRELIDLGEFFKHKPRACTGSSTETDTETESWSEVGSESGSESQVSGEQQCGRRAEGEGLGPHVGVMALAKAKLRADMIVKPGMDAEDSLSVEAGLPVELHDLEKPQFEGFGKRPWGFAGGLFLRPDGPRRRDGWVRGRTNLEGGNFAAAPSTEAAGEGR